MRQEIITDPANILKVVPTQFNHIRAIEVDERLTEA